MQRKCGAKRLAAKQRHSDAGHGRAKEKNGGAWRGEGKATQGEAREKRWAAKLRVEREDVIMDEDRH